MIKRLTVTKYTFFFFSYYYRRQNINMNKKHEKKKKRFPHELSVHKIPNLPKIKISMMQIH